MAATKSRTTKAAKKQQKRNPRKERAATGEGPILPDVVYPKWVFIKTLDTSEAAFYAMIDRGLEVVRDGKRVEVIGRDYLKYKEKLKAEQQAQHNDPSVPATQPASTASGGDGAS